MHEVAGDLEPFRCSRCASALPVTAERCTCPKMPGVGSARREAQPSMMFSTQSS